MSEINKGLRVLEDDLVEFNKEEGTLQKLQQKLNEITSTIIAYNPKEFVEDVKYANFYSSKEFILYSILWCHILNLNPEEEKSSANVDISALKIGSLTIEKIGGCVREFSKILNDFGQFQSKIKSFKAANVFKRKFGVDD